VLAFSSVVYSDLLSKLYKLWQNCPVILNSLATQTKKAYNGQDRVILKNQTIWSLNVKKIIPKFRQPLLSTVAYSLASVNPSCFKLSNLSYILRLEAYCPNLWQIHFYQSIWLKSQLYYLTKITLEAHCGAEQIC
jgi:hypothetical protein